MFHRVSQCAYFGVHVVANKKLVSCYLEKFTASRVEKSHFSKQFYSILAQRRKKRGRGL